MQDVSKLLGVRSLFEDPKLLEAFKQEFMTDDSYVRPGYGVDYYTHHTDSDAGIITTPFY